MLLTAAVFTAPTWASTPDWENHHVLQINREPARASFIPFGEVKGDRTLSLNGTWQFRWTKHPDERVVDFYRTDFDDRAWTALPVPANWEVNGYGTPIYASAGYVFKIDPPRVMGTPKQKFTTFEERNPVGQYRRSFTLPEGWSEGQTFLRFEGVMSAFYVWINGKQIGYSQGSMEPSEFNITTYLQPGENRIAVEVYRYSDGSYLEDQDFWRFGGIHRDVLLYHTGDVRLTDYAVRTLPDAAYRNFTLQIDPEFAVYRGERGEGYTFEATLTDADGEQVEQLAIPIEPVLDLNHKAANMNVYKDTAVIEFSQYMKLDSVTADMFSMNGSAVVGKVEAIDPKESAVDSGEMLARQFKLYYSGGKVTSITVSAEVLNYVGTAMEKNAVFDNLITEYETEGLAGEEKIVVVCGQEMIYQLHVQPAEAATSVKLFYKISDSYNVAITDIGEPDANGVIPIKILGNLPTTAVIDIYVEGSTISKRIEVQVTEKHPDDGEETTAREDVTTEGPSESNIAEPETSVENTDFTDEPKENNAAFLWIAVGLMAAAAILAVALAFAMKKRKKIE